MPTTSVGSINLAHAARRERSPVSSFIPCSIMRPTTGCETRFRTMDFGSESSTTRPGNNPGIPSGDCLTCGNPCTSIGGGSGSVTFSCPGALGSNPRNKPALPKQLAFTKVRRSMVGSEYKSRRTAYDTAHTLYNFCFTIVTIALRLDTLALQPATEDIFTMRNWIEI